MIVFWTITNGDDSREFELLKAIFNKILLGPKTYAMFLSSIFKWLYLLENFTTDSKTIKLITDLIISVQCLLKLMINIKFNHRMCQAMQNIHAY